MFLKKYLDIYLKKEKMPKHIKLFEQYNQYEADLVNSIYENWKSGLSEDLKSIFESKSLFENVEYWDEEKPLSSGEKAAMSRDFQIISKPQLAALYLKALGLEEEEPGKYIFKIPGIKDFAELDPNTGKIDITNAAFADAIGLESLGTVSRTVSKFRNLISGVGETAAESIYPKVVAAYEVFQGTNTDTLAALAGEAIQDATEFTKNREYQSALSARGAEQREAAKKEAQKLGLSVYTLINNLRRTPIFSDIQKAQSVAINKLSSETGINPDKIRNAYAEYLKGKGILNKQYFA